MFESGWARGTSLYDSMRAGSTATVEALTSQLRQREGALILSFYGTSQHSFSFFPLILSFYVIVEHQCSRYIQYDRYYMYTKLFCYNVFFFSIIL